MTIRVRFFALARDRFGADGRTLTLADGATVAAARRALAEQHPAAADLLPTVAFAVNRSYARPGDALADGDELAVLPPVSGG